MRKILPYLRLVTSFALLASVVWQVSDRLIHNVFRPGEYFAYLTIQSSLIAAVILAVAGVRELQGKADTKVLTLARLSTASYAIIVGVVYNALLRGTVVLPGDPDYGYNWPVAPNEILHVWGPLFIFLDFVLTITVTKLKFKQIFWVLLYPLAWLTFTVIRGLITDWWPYNFLNPNLGGGAVGVGIFVLEIMAFLLTSAVISLSLNKLRSKSAKH
ncbi:MAG: hypothetical protein RLZZ56_349 [Actinomycetota bacterium]|jgi:hypothetical protein